MAALFSSPKPSAPPPPLPAPKPPPPPPEKSDSEIGALADRQRRRASGSSIRTFLSGPGGQELGTSVGRFLQSANQ